MSLTVRPNTHVIEGSFKGKSVEIANGKEVAWEAVWEDDGGHIPIDYYESEEAIAEEEYEENSSLYGFDYPDYDFIRELKTDEEGFVKSPTYLNILAWTKYFWISLIGLAVIASGVMYYLNVVEVMDRRSFSIGEGIVIFLTVFILITVLESFRVTADQKVQFHNGHKYGFEEALDHVKMVINKGN